MYNRTITPRPALTDTACANDVATCVGNCVRLTHSTLLQINKIMQQATSNLGDSAKDDILAEFGADRDLIVRLLDQMEKFVAIYKLPAPEMRDIVPTFTLADLA